MSAEFIRRHTQVLSPPLVPEINLHLASETVPLWHKTEEELGEIGLAPPFWAFAWAGGQALARYVLDHPNIVSGLDVLDLASGSGLVAIAAARSGALRVLAADIDAFAREAIALNAALNGVAVEIWADDLLRAPPPACGAILVGDFFYEKTLASRTFDWLDTAASRGSAVLIGDPGRSYLPKDRLVRIAEYWVPVTRELEDSDIKATSVWRLRSNMCDNRPNGSGEWVSVE
ncbi:MAG: class I SAM-dependent methyltransferase [Hyphomicrobiales bacterium]